MEITFGIELPTITVKLLTFNDLREILKELKADASTFRGVPDLKPGDRYVLRGKDIVVTNHEGDLKVTSVGDFLVESSNGLRALTADPEVVKGDFSHLPHSLFTPKRGEVFQRWS